MKKLFADWKVILGFLLSVFFMYLAFKEVKIKEMIHAFSEANYWWLVPVLVITFFSHWLRSVRWRYLLEPIQRIQTGSLFSALLIGYMFNIFLPAHLGELVRAYVTSKKSPISASAVFGTIVIERILDVFSLFFLMAIALIVFPFPKAVQQGGYFIFILSLMLLALLILAKKFPDRSIGLTQKLLRPFPEHWRRRFIELILSFLDGIVPLKRKSHYLIVTILTILIWACYGYAFQLVLYGFDFWQKNPLPLTAPLVLLVITTFGVLVPSSPGYVGTYHFLCKFTLALPQYSVHESDALTFAFVMHGINFLPILIVGLILISLQGMNIHTIQKGSQDVVVHKKN